MKLRSSDRFLYPGALWQNQDAKVTVYTASLESVTYITNGSTSQRSLMINDFISLFEPVVTSDHVVDALLQVLPDDLADTVNKESSYTSLAVKFLSVLNAVNPDWYNDPDITYQLLRFGIEGVVAFELNATGETGKGEEQVTRLVQELYRDVSSATDKIVVQILADRMPKSSQ